MGHLICDKCGSCYELQEGESPDDFNLTCECGGKLKYKESMDSCSKSDQDKMKWILIFAGFVFILISFARYSEYKSLIDIFNLTIGMMCIIWGFFIKKEFKVTTTYLVVISCMTIIQWLILIYILFISKVYVTNDLFILAFAPLVTISLIIQIRTSDLKYIGNPKKTNKDVIFADKFKKILNIKGKTLLISAGFLITIVCLGSFIISRNPVELLVSSVGLMLIVYGYYRENTIVMPPDYAAGFSSKSLFYRGTSKIRVTAGYFLAMTSVLLFQWIILYFIYFIYLHYVSTEVFNSELYMASYVTFYTMMTTFFYFIQIRESHLIEINWQRIYIGDKKIF